VSLPLNLQFFNLPGIEPRAPGQTKAGAGIDHQLIITFPTAVSFTNIVATSGAAVVSSFTGNNSSAVTINLASVSNAQKTTITLQGVNDGTNTNDVAVQMGVLLGDVNGNGVLSNADVSLVKAQVAAGGNVTSTNFRNDVNANGVITNADVSVVKAQVAAGAQLP
jgi:Dockerin type I domain